jgi:hypothetical protein
VHIQGALWLGGELFAVTGQPCLTQGVLTHCAGTLLPKPNMLSTVPPWCTMVPQHGAPHLESYNVCFLVHTMQEVYVVTIESECMSELSPGTGLTACAWIQSSSQPVECGCHAAWFACSSAACRMSATCTCLT